jgi:hypothetical protein
MWRSGWSWVVCGVVVLPLGCGQAERKNDPGPPLELVPGGPPPMQPPGAGDTTPPGPPKKPKGK